MLSDAEQRRLAEIEASLMADDHRLARRFDRPWRHRRPPVIAVVLTILMTWIVTVSALVSGSVTVATLGLIAMVVTAVVWATRRRR